ncbi:MAG TPA: ABC transporter ATP-binding protein [Pilimelia sp.]|nr:ABC transporter ATP-binding protein [Pilimelia sp.]
MSAAVEVRELVKRYPKRDANAVDGLSFAVAAGEVFGLLGPNGAGKTTTVGILTTMVRATAGYAAVGGVDVRADPVRARARLAVVPQRSNLDRSLTPRQNLTFHAAYHGFPRAQRNARAAVLLDEFGLAEQADVKVDWYSGGMAQRLMIARSLMHEPQVLFLDEPTTGLDPQSRRFVWERVRQLRDRGVTIVLTTHDMDEAADLSDRVGIMDHGRLLALDTPAGLIRGLSGESVLDLTVAPAAGDTGDKLLAALADLAGVLRGEDVAQPGAAGLRLRLYLAAEPAALLGPVAAALHARGAQLSDVHVGEPSLEDVFIDLTGRGLR